MELNVDWQLVGMLFNILVVCDKTFTPVNSSDSAHDAIVDHGDVARLGHFARFIKAWSIENDVICLPFHLACDKH